MVVIYLLCLMAAVKSSGEAFEDEPHAYRKSHLLCKKVYVLFGKHGRSPIFFNR
jgi:hypothetical protein